MVTETGLHVEITADIAQFDAKLKAAQARLTATSTTFAEFSGVFPKFEKNIRGSIDGLTRLEREALHVEKALKKAGVNATAAGNTLVKFGQQSGKPTQNVANLTAQINDIGVMLQAGQSPFMLAIQQGTQMNQVLDNLGTTGTARLKAVGEAITSAIKPANLLTVGLIAAGAALAQWAIRSMTAEKETDALRMTLDDARASIEEITEKLRLMQLNLTPEEDAFVRAVENAKQGVIEQQAEVDELNNLIARGAVGLQATVAEQERILAQRKETLRLAEEELLNARVRQNEAETFTDELKEQEKETAATRMAFEAYEAALTAAIDEAFLLRELTKQTATSAEAFAAAMAKTGQVSPIGKAAGGVTPGKKDTGKGETTPKGGAAVADTLATDLEALQTALMTAEEAQLASFTRQQEILEAALEKQLLTRQEYNELMLRAQGEHQAAMTQIDAYAYGNNVDKLAAFMGDAASVLAEGNEDMLKISRAFAAAQALISTLQGAAKELEKGTFGFAQAAAVIAKGMSFITAINGVTAGSASAGTAAAADTTGTTSAGTAAATTSAQVAIQLSGGDMFSRDQVISLINSINEAVEDGAELRLV